MKELTPSEAANIAEGAYRVNDGSEQDLKIFLNNPLFKNSIQENNKKILQAAVGGRLFRANQDSFGVMARGEKDLF